MAGVKGCTFPAQDGIKVHNLAERGASATRRRRIGTGERSVITYTRLGRSAKSVACDMTECLVAAYKKEE